MTSDDLTPEQVRALQAVVGRYLRFLGLLRGRMDLRGFASVDSVYRLVKEAHDATHALSVELHYLAVGSGVGRTARTDRKSQ